MVATEASATPREALGAGMALQSCPKLHEYPVPAVTKYCRLSMDLKISLDSNHSSTTKELSDSGPLTQTL